MAVFRQRFTIEYDDTERERIEDSEPRSDGSRARGWRTVARLRKRCDVEVIIDLDKAAQRMGARACRSKGGKCVDGYLTVKSMGNEMTLSRNEV